MVACAIAVKILMNSNIILDSVKTQTPEVKVSELSTHSVILNNVEKIPIKRNEELTFLELYPGSLSQ